MKGWKEVFGIMIALLVSGLIAIKAFPTLNVVGLSDLHLANALNLYEILCWVGVVLTSVLSFVMLAMKGSRIAEQAAEFVEAFESPSYKLSMLLGWMNILMMGLVIMDWSFVLILVLGQAASYGLYFVSKMKVRA